MLTTGLAEVASLAFPICCLRYSRQQQPGRPEPPVPQGDTAPPLLRGSHVSQLLCKHTAMPSSAQKDGEARTSKVSASFARQDDIQDDAQYLLANY